MMVLLSEWTKLRALRSTYVTLLVAAVTALLASGIVAVSTASVQASQAPPFGAVAGIFAGWLSYPALAVGILGIITITAEYSSGQIRLTFTAVPRRLSVLAAKAAVTGLTGLVLGEVLAFTGYGLTAAALAGRPLAGTLSGASIHVLAGGLSLCAVILLGLGIGTISRHTAGAIFTLPAVLYLPLIVFALPAPWKDEIGRFTLVGAVYQLIATHPSEQLFSPGLSLTVMLAWPAVALAVAAVVITRHDA
jgi:ABC-2 type transport system permease protein